MANGDVQKYRRQRIQAEEQYKNRETRGPSDRLTSIYQKLGKPIPTPPPIVQPTQSPPPEKPFGIPFGRQKDKK